ncbi:MAG: isoprenylcysteine carboxylmethyltransferase family protein [Pseudomonadota bacterium]
MRKHETLMFGAQPVNDRDEAFEDGVKAPHADGQKATHIARLVELIGGALQPPPGRARILAALGIGIVVHSVFSLAVVAMILAMYFGMSRSLGAVPWPHATLANALLVLQFPLVHSLLLTSRGSRWLARIVPGVYGSTLSTTTYAIIASLQLLVLFVLWTPSGTIWWQAQGWGLVGMSCLYAASWLLLMKASFDAGAEVQSGALGWLSMLQNRKPRFPDMPTTGLFRIIRQPIYVAFALTLWTVPVWTPDQLVLAITFTAYCLLAPLMKERRFAARYGARFQAYKHRVPYAIPSFRNVTGRE